MMEKHQEVVSDLFINGGVGVLEVRVWGVRLNNLLIASNKGRISLFDLVEFSAAFDTIDHQILI